MNAEGAQRLCAGKISVCSGRRFLEQVEGATTQVSLCVYQLPIAGHEASRGVTYPNLTPILAELPAQRSTRAGESSRGLWRRPRRLREPALRRFSSGEVGVAARLVALANMSFAFVMGARLDA
eukprot:ctg_364.g223